MAWRGEKVCEWSDMPVDQCAHCTGDLHAFEKSMEEPASVDDPDMWVDDED